MIVWSGWGFLAPVIWAVVLLLTQQAVDGIYHEGYCAKHNWPMIVGCLLPAPILWLAGRIMNGRSDSPERQARGAAHTFFGVPMEYSGIILAGLGVISILIRPTK
jgi:hypothetical protein